MYRAIFNTLGNFSHMEGLRTGRGCTIPVPRTVLLDANALLMPFQFRINLEAELRRLLGDVDIVVPGHGPVTTKAALDEQRATLLEWKTAVAVAVARGWSRDETIARGNFADRGPADVGPGYMMEYIQTLNAGSLWDKLTAGSPRGAG